MRAAQAGDRAQIDHRARGSVHGIEQLPIEHIDAALQRAPHSNRQHTLLRLVHQFPMQRAAMVVIDPEHGPITRALVAQYASLGARIARQAAVSFEVVWAHVQDYRHGATQLLGQLELVRGQLQHIGVVDRFRP